MRTCDGYFSQSPLPFTYVFDTSLQGQSLFAGLSTPRTAPERGVSLGLHQLCAHTVVLQSAVRPYLSPIFAAVFVRIPARKDYM